MKQITRVALFALAALPLLAACGGDDDDNCADTGDTGATGCDGVPAAASKSGAKQQRDPASVDVCALLPKADAEAAADVIRQRDGRGTGTKYDITVTKDEVVPNAVRAVSGCKFVLDQTDSDGYRGVIQVQVQAADAFDFYRGQGKKVEGLGDEAVSVTGSTVVRVGDLMLSVGQNSYTESFSNEILRKMAARLK